MNLTPGSAGQALVTTALLVALAAVMRLIGLRIIASVHPDCAQGSPASDETIAPEPEHCQQCDRPTNDAEGGDCWECLVGISGL